MIHNLHNLILRINGQILLKKNSMSECKNGLKLHYQLKRFFTPILTSTILHSSLLANGSHSHEVKQIYLNLDPLYLLKGVPNSAKKGVPNNAKTVKHTV